MATKTKRAKPEPTPRARLHVHAATQLGHFTAEQARTCGVSRSVLSRMVGVGEIVRVHRGVYRFAALRETEMGAVMAALLLLGDTTAAAARRTSLRLQGITRVDEPDSIELVTTGPSGSAVSGVTLYRTTRLDACDLVAHPTCSALRMTTAARSAIDLAATLAWDQIAALVDDLICASLTNRSWLNRRARTLSKGRVGVGVIIRLTEPGAEGVFRSWLERTTAGLWAEHGIPRPQWNVELSDERGKIGIVDAFWAEHGVVVELEGLRFHTTPAQRERDAPRFNRLGKRHRVLRFTWLDVVRRPEYVVDEVREALAATAAAR